jgi:uncharacterized membrane protein
MVKAKLIPRMRASARQVKVAVLRRRALANIEQSRVRPGSKQEIWKTLLHRAATMRYDLQEALFLPSEERQALPRRFAAAVAKALGVAAPRVAGSITIGRPRGEVARAFLRLEDLRQWMKTLGRVEGSHGEDAVAIALRFEDAKSLERAGVVAFTTAPAKRGTEVKAVLPGAHPRAKIARAIARLLAEMPKAALIGDLRRLKQCIETGEIPTTRGQSSGRKAA